MRVLMLATLCVLACATLARADEPPAPPPPQADTAAPDRAGYAYSYALHDARYDDTIVSFEAYKPLGSRAAKIRPFVGWSFVRDSRTAGGAVPLVLSDNYATAGVGLQYTNGSGLRAFVQAGGSATLGSVAAVPSGGDLRGGVQYYRDFGTPSPSHHGYGNLYASVTDYSRYQDAVAYVQLEQAMVLGSAAHALEPFLREVVLADRRRLYYDNTVEATLGLRWHPAGPHGPTLSLEGALGAYTAGAVRPAGVGPTYRDFRPTVSYGFAL